MRRVKQAIRELVSVFAEEETAQIGEMGNNRFFRAARQNIFVFFIVSIDKFRWKCYDRTILFGR